METLEELDLEIEKIEESYERKLNEFDFSKSFEEFTKFMQPETSILASLSRKRRMITGYNLSDIPDYADVMSLQEFIDACNCGGFIDSDGFGHYVLDGKETDIDIFPSDIKHKCIRKEFDSVAWYNK